MVNADSAERVAFGSVVRHAPIGQGKVARRMVGRIVDQYQVREALAALRYALAQAREVEIGMDVGIHGEKWRRSQERQCGRDSAGGLERLGFPRVSNANVPAPAVSKRAFDTV